MNDIEAFMMLDVNDPDFFNTAWKLYDTTNDERVRSLCEGLIEGERTVRTLQWELQQVNDKILKADEEIQKLEAEIRKRDKEIEKAENEIQKREQELAQLDALKQQKQ